MSCSDVHCHDNDQEMSVRLLDCTCVLNLCCLTRLDPIKLRILWTSVSLLSILIHTYVIVEVAIQTIKAIHLVGDKEGKEGRKSWHSHAAYASPTFWFYFHTMSCSQIASFPRPTALLMVNL